MADTATPQVQLAELRAKLTAKLALADAATPGPWEPWDWTQEYDNLIVEGKGIIPSHWDADYGCMAFLPDGTDGDEQANARFIADARTTTPAALRTLLAVCDFVEALLAPEYRIRPMDVEPPDYARYHSALALLALLERELEELS